MDSEPKYADIGVSPKFLQTEDALVNLNHVGSIKKTASGQIRLISPKGRVLGVLFYDTQEECKQGFDSLCWFLDIGESIFCKEGREEDKDYDDF